MPSEQEFLGTGGGTHPYLELLNIEKLYNAGRSVRLIDPLDLSDDDLVAELGYMGAPLVTKERLPDPEHICRPVRLMADLTGARFAAVMTGEIGAENGILPLLVAALMDVPVVDADTMGRAFPEMQMSSFVIRGLSLTPFVLCDIRGNDVFLDSRRQTDCCRTNRQADLHRDGRDGRDLQATPARQRGKSSWCPRERESRHQARQGCPGLS